MKIDVISGFLGAGKTTLIKKLLRDELSKEKIAIIENEYGEVGIDGSLFKEDKVEVKEITSGCICCNIKGDFKESILEIVNQYRPERIIIEPSGVAKLSQIIDSIKSANINGARINMKITVVDAKNVDMYIRNFGEFYKNQIISANTIILSRSQHLKADELDDVCKKIKQINSKATLVTTPWEALTSKRILEVGEQRIEDLITDKAIKRPNNFSKVSLSATEIFDNWTSETSKAFSNLEIKNILKLLEEDTKYGEILRVKGIVKGIDNKWIKFDFIPNDIRIVDYQSDYTGRICVIGKGLNKNHISDLFFK